MSTLDYPSPQTPHAGGALSAPAAPYARIKQHLKDELARGRWPPGAPMPSDADLVAQFGVSRMTVTRAVNELRAEGLIDRVQGVGTFAAQLRVSSTLRIRDLHEEIHSRGHRHHLVVHVARQEAATEGLAGRLGLAVGAPVFHTLMVHFENDVPLQCEDRYVNPNRAPEYLKCDFKQMTPTQYLLQVAPFREAQYWVEAAVPTGQEAKLLGIRREEPCLVVVRRTVGPDGPITLGRLVHPGSRYLLQGEVKP